MNRLKKLIVISVFCVSTIFCSEQDIFKKRDKNLFNRYVSAMLHSRTQQESEHIELGFELDRNAILKNLKELELQEIKATVKCLMNSLLVYTPELDESANKLVVSIAKQLFPDAMRLKSLSPLDVQIYKRDVLIHMATFLFKYMHASDMGEVCCQCDIGNGQLIRLCLQGFVGIGSSQRIVAPISIGLK